MTIASLISLVFATALLQPRSAAAAGHTRIVLREAALQSGYTVRNLEGTFSVGVPGNSLSGAKEVIVKLRKIPSSEKFSLAGQTLVGDLYKYQLRSDASVQLQKRLWLQLSYPTDTKDTVIKYWHNKRQRWIRVKTRHNKATLQAFAQLKRSTAVVGVFTRRQVSTGNVVEGTASWYNGTVAATNAFPMGSVIRVTNTVTGQAVETIVGSTWSGDTKYGWLLDLPKDAFAAIGDISSGLMHVKVEQL